MYYFLGTVFLRQYKISLFHETYLYIYNKVWFIKYWAVWATTLRFGMIILVGNINLCVIFYKGQGT